MAIEIVPYTSEREPAVRAFNQRLSGQSEPVFFQFPEHHVSSWLPHEEGKRVYAQMYLAVEDGVTVRGGYICKIQDFWIQGEVRTVANLGLPLSEGIVDPRYRFLGVQLIRDALRRQPLLYCLGMGGVEQPLPKILSSLGWAVFLVPFAFRLCRPGRCLRQMPRFRATRGRRLISAAAAWSGAGWLGARVLQSRAVRRGSRVVGARAVPVAHFDTWTDEVWDAARGDYVFSAVRDRLAMETLYGGSEFRNLQVLQVLRQGRTIGWVLVGDSVMENHRHFGNLRVGSLIDGFARPEDAPAAVAQAARYLEERGVDLIVSNQSHVAWRGALKSAGFLNGPSNFALALSKGLSALVVPWETRWPEYHFNRGDGDGPINL